MTRSRWIIFIIVALAILTGLVLSSSSKRVDVSSADPHAIITEGDNADHIYGNANADITLVEYADFQCPGCESAFRPIKDIKEQYKDSVRFVFRNFPLTSIHPNALAAAYSAESANLQGKFWEMHDLLFQNQTSWSKASTDERTMAFEAYASQLGINVEKFRQDLSSESVAYKVSYDRAIAGKLNITSTPTFYLNGEKLDEATVADVIQNDGQLLKTKLDAIISQSKVTPGN